ncbi:MAG: YqgE/AlgH family protein [Myxococcota bacterium]
MASDLAPSLLVAMDLILDPNFRRTVVLMLEHDAEQGALGLVVNRPSRFPMSRLCESLEMSWRGDAEETVDWGGPVGEGQGWVVMDDVAAEGLEVVTLAPGIHWSRSQDALRRVADEPGLCARVFLGYAGWGEGQLEREIAEGSWLVVPLARQLVFDEPHDRVWAQSVRSLGIEPATLVPSPGVN